MSKVDSNEKDTFTLGEMREAYLKYVRGEKLTEKEWDLARAKSAAIKVSCGAASPSEEMR